jgi:DNA topoisomerase-1
MNVAATTPIDMTTLFRVNRLTKALPPDQCGPDRPEQVARAAGLRYTTDTDPGITRKATKRGFRYIDASGERVRDEITLARIRALAIPPAWRDVWICPRADGHLQATGRDDRRRKQYRYHPHWRTVRDETKYGRMLEFGRALPAIRASVEADLAQPGLSRAKVVAAVVKLLEQTLIRVGNEEYARANDSYGLTTMRDEHVAVQGTTLKFAFRGKSGKEHQIGIRDRRLARIVRSCRDLPGQVLFQYVDESGNQHPIDSADVNDYLRKASGREFTAKDFRTWHGSLLAIEALNGVEPAEDERERRSQLLRAVEQVSEHLGNTPAVCRRCYIHPVVFAAFDDGALIMNDQGRSSEAALIDLLNAALPT